MRKVMFACSALAALLLCVGGTAFAVEPNVPLRERLADRPLARLIIGQLGRLMVLGSKLNLTPEQRLQIKNILESHRAEILGVAKPIAEKRRALRDAVLAQNPDEQAIRAAADALGKVVGDAAVLAAKVKTEVRAVLTEEQRQKIDEFRAESDKAVDDFFTEAAEK